MQSDATFKSSPPALRGGLIVLTVVPFLMCACTSETVPVVAEEPLDLIGTNWQVEDIDERGVIDRSNITVKFEADNRLTGSAGCNRYFGNVTVGSGNVVVTGTGSSRKACVPALMQQEHRFLTALQEARHYEPDGDFLMLFDEAGERRIKLIRVQATHLVGGQPVPQDRIDPSAASVLHFICDNEIRFDVRFVGPETLRLTLADDEHILMRERSASGAAYSGDGITFWNKGSEAILLIDDMKYQCQRSY